MPFKRRNPKHLSAHFRDAVWPKMGWRRAFKYYRLRLIRLDDTPNRIAFGIANGVVVCFTPLPLLHLFQGLALSFLMRGNILATIVSSWLGNPWTYPFMWAAAWAVGREFFRMIGWAVPDIPTNAGFSELWNMMMSNPVGVMVPWIVGGYLVGVLAWPVVFYAVRPIVTRAQETRVYMRRRARVLRRRADQLAARAIRDMVRHGPHGGAI